MDTRVLIGRFVGRLPRGKIFITRELLTFGTRGAVDSITSWMVRSGMIIRLANGVFVRSDKDLEIPSLQEIVEAKARASVKFAQCTGEKVAQDFELTPRLRRRSKSKKKEDPPFVATYGVLGCTSSFETIYGRVQFRHTSPRKYFLNKSVAAKPLAAWWASDEENLLPLIKGHVNSLRKTEKRRFKEVGAWAPAWISDCILDDPPRYSTQPPKTIFPKLLPNDWDLPAAPGPIVAEESAVYRIKNASSANASLHESFCECQFWEIKRPLTKCGAHTVSFNSIAVNAS